MEQFRVDIRHLFPLEPMTAGASVFFSERICSSSHASGSGISCGFNNFLEGARRVHSTDCGRLGLGGGVGGCYLGRAIDKRLATGSIRPEDPISKGRAGVDMVRSEAGRLCAAFAEIRRH